MMPRNFPPIGAKKNDCAVEIRFLRHSHHCLLYCVFPKNFLRVFSYFSVKMCVFILLFYSVTSYDVCYFIIQSVRRLNEYEV